MNQEQERQKAKDCADEKSSKAEILVIEVDDFEEWRKFIVEQEYAADEKYINQGCEFGGKKKWVYRGQSDATWPIASSFERLLTPAVKKIKCFERALRGRERESILEFKKRAWHYVPDPNMSYLEWLTLMRHHGVPTRLVDFSESALIALYFALQPSKVENANCVGDGNNVKQSDFAVWALNRESLKGYFQQSCVGKVIPGFNDLREKYGQSFFEKMNDPECDDPFFDRAREFIANFQHSYTTEVITSEVNRELASRILEAPLDSSQDVAGDIPLIYFYPERPSARMLAQKGLFVMSTKISTPFMKALCGGVEAEDFQNAPIIKLSELGNSKSQVPDASLIKFLFKRSMEDEVREMLRMANVGHDMIYPDIQGVADAVSSKIKQSFIGYLNVDELRSGGTLNTSEIEDRMKKNRSAMLKVWG